MLKVGRRPSSTYAPHVLGQSISVGRQNERTIMPRIWVLRNTNLLSFLGKLQCAIFTGAGGDFVIGLRGASFVQTLGGGINEVGGLAARHTGNTLPDKFTEGEARTWGRVEGPSSRGSRLASWW